MANKAISELPQAQNVNNQDLFVLEQSGIAKKLTAETFITEQGIIDALAEALDGHGGIQSVTLSSVSGRIRTYLITFTDGTSTTFQVLDGTSIDRIVKTSTAGLTDTYTVFMSDGTTTFFTVTNGADGTVSEAMLNDALKDKAPAITETTESSAIANFTDGADDLVMHNIVVEIAPVQSGSGDPSPSNIRPISGWTGCNVTRTGANVWDEEWELGSYNTTTGAKSTSSAGRIRCTNFISVAQGVQYYASAVVDGVLFYDQGKNYISYITVPTGRTFVIPNGIWFITFFTKTNYGATYNNDISINYPSTDHDYHAYQGSNTVTVDWTTEAGTVYGGTIDVATGLLTVDRAITSFNGSETWYKDNYIYATGYAGITALQGACSHFPYATSNIYASNGVGISSWAFIVGSGLATNYTLDEWKSFLQTQANNGTPVTVAYGIRTPQTYQLTPQQLMTLYGNNSVWADVGNVSVTYPADTKLYIQNLTQPSEDDMTADHAISSGTFFMLGNNLYLATAAIASGATIIEGTNATRLSLADALNTINS